MVLAVQNPFESCIVWRRNRAASMWALEAWLVICLTLHCYLFDRIHSFTASSTFLLCTREHASNSTRGPCQLRTWFLSRFCRWLKVLVEATRLLEELLIMRLTVQHTFHWWVSAQLKPAFAVSAFEARFVVANSISWEKLHRVHCLLASLAFLLSSCKRHPSPSSPLSPWAETVQDLILHERK